MTRIMIASDHQITAHGLSALINTNLTDCKAIEMDIEDIPSILSGQVPCDLLIHVNGCCSEKAEGFWEKATVPVLHIINGLGFIKVQALYKSGARGVIEISNKANVVLDAIEEVLNGHTFMEQTFKEQLLKATAGFISKESQLAYSLTKRERQIAELMLEGKKMCEIGECLGLKASTVTTFKTKIFEKFGVDNVLKLNLAYGPRSKAFV